MGTVRRAKWLNALNVPLKCDSKGQGSLCSLHFMDSDMHVVEINGVKRTMLRTNAVPTLKKVEPTLQIDTNTTLKTESVENDQIQPK